MKAFECAHLPPLPIFVAHLRRFASHDTVKISAPHAMSRAWGVLGCHRNAKTRIGERLQQVEGRSISDQVQVKFKSIATHWHASQVGSSTPQKAMSVAGIAFICSRAAAAAASIALIPPAPLVASEGTALSCRLVTVLISTWVALWVRR